MPTKSQVDKLGERLRHGDPTDEDIRLLNDYRRSFSDFADSLRERLQANLHATVVERRGKSTPSIVAKLRRQTTKLSQMQDIVGFRIVVADRATQDDIISSLKKLLPNCKVVDRRDEPQFGYRAVHVIVKEGDFSAEIQVRTELQHAWAQLTEKLADTLGQEIKYGGGSEAVKEMLSGASGLVASVERIEEYDRRIKAMKAELKRRRDAGEDIDLPEIEDNVESTEEHRKEVMALFQSFVSELFP